MKSTTVVQGEYKISSNPDEVLSTILGSCVSVCLNDQNHGVGRMNHFLLPSRNGTSNSDIRFGAHAMELLINDLLKAGAKRHLLQAKVFGGSSMSSNLGDIGKSNANFARNFLANEGIPIVSESLGGTSARRVKYWPATGRAQLMTVPNDPDLQVARAPNAQPRTQDITLF